MWAALAAAAAAVIGGVASRREGSRQREFANRQSSSAHQRAMTDLRLAGLNPILAAQQPAASPTPSTPDPGRGLTSGGIAAASLMLERKKVAADVDLKTSTARKLDEETNIRHFDTEGARWKAQLFRRLNQMLQGAPSGTGILDMLNKIIGGDTSKSSAKRLLGPKQKWHHDVWKRPKKQRKPRIFRPGDTIPPHTKGRWTKGPDGILIFKETD